METWNDTSYQLSAQDAPCVSVHKNGVSLHLPGYMGDGRGFSLHLGPAQLPQLRELVLRLEELEADWPEHDAPLDQQSPAGLTLDLDPEAAEAAPGMEERGQDSYGG